MEKSSPDVFYKLGENNHMQNAHRDKRVVRLEKCLEDMTPYELEIRLDNARSRLKADGYIQDQELDCVRVMDDDEKTMLLVIGYKDVIKYGNGAIRNREGE